jgi:hypothetical protein
MFCMRFLKDGSYMLVTHERGSYIGGYSVLTNDTAAIESLCL